MSKTDIIKLPVAEPDTGIIELIGKYFELAKQGQIKGIAIACTKLNGESSSAYQLHPTLGDKFQLMGTTTWLQSRMNAATRGDLNGV